ncbi:lipase family protein [Nocardia brasiliensis]|uniref:lipase family protein n=1 Tax=Nocardia brasiliensis TaxID=37326 RepID=UPI00142DBDA2|nr:lipase family protein [Nocardia brasiliensis]
MKEKVIVDRGVGMSTRSIAAWIAGFLAVALAVFSAVYPVSSSAGGFGAAGADRAPGGVAQVVAGGDVQGSGKAVEFSYWTRWADGEPVLSRAHLWLPEGDAPAGGWPVVSYAHGTSGNGDQCVGGTSASEEEPLTSLLRGGYAVTATFYPGIGTPDTPRHLDGVTEAHAVIDAVRASRTLDSRLGSRWAAMGVSQGGHAALNAAAIAAADAPELDFRGAVSFSTPPDLSLFAQARPGVPDIPMMHELTSQVALVLAGIRAARPDLNVDDYLTAEGKRVLGMTNTLCIKGLNEATAGLGIGDLLSRPIPGSPLEAPLQRYVATPTSGYARPLFIAHGYKDILAPLPALAPLLAQMAVNGVRPDFRIYDADHGGVVGAATSDALVFLDRIVR